MEQGSFWQLRSQNGDYNWETGLNIFIIVLNYFKKPWLNSVFYSFVLFLLK